MFYSNIGRGMRVRFRVQTLFKHEDDDDDDKRKQVPPPGTAKGKNQKDDDDDRKGPRQREKADRW